MDFTLDQPRRIFKESVRKLAERHIAERALKRAKDASFPIDVAKITADTVHPQGRTPDHRDVAQGDGGDLFHREVTPLLSDDHFSVDSTLLKAWAAMKSFQPQVIDAPPDDDPGSPPHPETSAEDHPGLHPSENRPEAPPRPPVPQCRNRLLGWWSHQHEPMPRSLG